MNYSLFSKRVVFFLLAFSLQLLSFETHAKCRPSASLIKKMGLYEAYSDGSEVRNVWRTRVEFDFADIKFTKSCEPYLGMGTAGSRACIGESTDLYFSRYSQFSESKEVDLEFIKLVRKKELKEALNFCAKSGGTPILDENGKPKLFTLKDKSEVVVRKASSGFLIGLIPVPRTCYEWDLEYRCRF